MSVIVEQLSKIYGTQHAVDGISFEAKKGEILGFLGPNGAGKSTTMKILTCFIPQSSGSAKICGFDTTTDAMEVKKRIGYLPEHNPLYKEMYVKEYLRFIGSLHKIPNLNQEVERMIEKTGLGPERHKQIHQLSRGYKQRVGLAQAMLHNPEVLILDEPTSGLDPNQLVEIRSLIKELGKEKTVIFSSHIMQEVQALCDKVIIINKGKLVANNRIEDLKGNKSEQNIITVEFAGLLSKDLLKKIKDVNRIQAVSPSVFQFYCDGEKDIRKDIFQFAVDHQFVILEMRKEKSTIEDVFHQLTQSV
jgi:ABC-2 type transport system ATP-binding protein